MANERAKTTARLIQIRRSIGLRDRRRAVPRQLPPRAIERAFASELIRIVRLVQASLDPLISELPILVDRVTQERRFDAGEGRRVQEIMRAIRESLQTQLSETELIRIAAAFADRASAFNKKQLERQIKAALGIDILTIDAKIPALLDAFVSENVPLIRDLPAKLLGDVERTVTRAFTTGKNTSDLMDEIQNLLKISRNRARVIARDQIGKLNGQLNRTRQQEIGVSRFIWRTARDERVRDEHEELEGKEFSYDDPPSEGFPGEPIQCRCYPEPVFDTIRELAG